MCSGLALHDKTTELKIVECIVLSIGKYTEMQMADSFDQALTGVAVTQALHAVQIWSKSLSKKMEIFPSNSSDFYLI